MKKPAKLKMFVICQNDFPIAVATSFIKAAQYGTKKRKEVNAEVEKRRREGYAASTIYIHIEEVSLID